MAWFAAARCGHYATAPDCGKATSLRVFFGAVSGLRYGPLGTAIVFASTAFNCQECGAAPWRKLPGAVRRNDFWFNCVQLHWLSGVALVAASIVLIVW